MAPSIAKKANLAVIVEQEMPAGVPISVLDAVSDEMGVELIRRKALSCTLTTRRTDTSTFSTRGSRPNPTTSSLSLRLMPAMGEVAAGRGFELSDTTPLGCDGGSPLGAWALTVPS